MVTSRSTNTSSSSSSAMSSSESSEDISIQLGSSKEYWNRSSTSTCSSLRILATSSSSELLAKSLSSTIDSDESLETSNRFSSSSTSIASSSWSLWFSTACSTFTIAPPRSEWLLEISELFSSKNSSSGSSCVSKYENIDKLAMEPLWSLSDIEVELSSPSTSIATTDSSIRSSLRLLGRTFRPSLLLDLLLETFAKEGLLKISSSIFQFLLHFHQSLCSN